MNLAWGTVKVTGDHFYPTLDHLNLIFRTVESDRRSEKSDLAKLHRRSRSDPLFDKSQPGKCLCCATTP
jgi:hypothetical protein